MIFNQESRKFLTDFLLNKYPALRGKEPILEPFTALYRPAVVGTLLPKISDIYYFCLCTTNDNSGYKFWLDNENCFLEEQTTTPVIFDRLDAANNLKDMILTGYKITFK